MKMKSLKSIRMVPPLIIPVGITTGIGGGSLFMVAGLDIWVFAAFLIALMIICIASLVMRD